jgi:carbamoyltransferase
VFREAMVTWLSDKLWIKHHIQKRLGVRTRRCFLASTTPSHAASAFFCSPFDEAAILTVDGVGEWATASLGVGKGQTSRCTKRFAFPTRWGFLYSAFTAFLGFEVNEGRI